MDAVLNWLWQGSLVAIVTEVLLRALDRAPAHTRYCVCWVAVIAVLVLPLLSLAPGWDEPVPGHTVSAGPEGLISLQANWWTSPTTLAIAWGLWSAVYASRLAAHAIALRKVKNRCQSFPSDLAERLMYWAHVRGTGRPALLRLSKDVRAAAVLGWGSPVIAVAPELLIRLSPEELDRVVIHEWAHIQRHDDVADVVRLVVAVLAGWHPAAWWLTRRLQAEREIACDELTIAVTGSAKQYAACLVKLASLPHARLSELTSLGALSSPALVGRIRRIISRRPTSSAWTRPAATASISALAVLSVIVARVAVFKTTVPSVEVTTQSVDLNAWRGLSVQASPSTASVSSDRERAPKPRIAATLRQPPPAILVRRNHAASAFSTVPATLIDSSQEESVSPSEVIPFPATSATAPLDAPPDESPSHPPLAIRQSTDASLWHAAANAGVAVGSDSKRAGLATASYFSRIGKRIAASF